MSVNKRLDTATERLVTAALLVEVAAPCGGVGLRQRCVKDFAFANCLAS